MATVDASARVVDDADANACAYAKAACKEALAGKEGAETLLRVLEGATNKESADTEADTEALTFSLFDKDSSSNSTTPAPAPETHGAGDTPAPEPGRRNIDTDMERWRMKGSCWFGGGGGREQTSPKGKGGRACFLKCISNANGNANRGLEN